MNKSVLIIGSSISGIQAAIDLAEAGNKVHLVEASPFLGRRGSMAMPKHVLNTRLLEIARHPNIHIWTNAHLNRLDGMIGDFRVELSCQPR